MSEKLYRIKPLVWANGDLDESELWWRANSNFGRFDLLRLRDESWLLATPEDLIPSRRCDSLDHGKSLADAWYRERMAEGLTQVTAGHLGAVSSIRSHAINQLDWAEHYKIAPTGTGCGEAAVEMALFYLENTRDDDGEPIAEEWIAGLNFKQNAQMPWHWLHRDFSMVMWDRRENELFIGHNQFGWHRVGDPATRGQLRRLCAALGVELGEVAR